MGFNLNSIMEYLKTLSKDELEKINKLFDDNQLKQFLTVLTNEQRITLLRELEKQEGISENGRWMAKWDILKYKNREEYENNTPYEVATIKENLLLDNGVTTLWKLFANIDSQIPFSSANAVMKVGDNTTAESASQTDILATVNKASKKVEAGFPTVTGRTITYQTTFEENEANFAWQEFAIANGTGGNNVSINRKVEYKGTKNGGIWTLRATITLN